MTKRIPTRIVANSIGNVTLTEVDCGTLVVREFICPPDGGYVREFIKRTGEYRQVCEKLDSQGQTLWSAGRNDLLGIIRRENRKSRRAQLRIERGEV